MSSGIHPGLTCFKSWYTFVLSSIFSTVISRKRMLFPAAIFSVTTGYWPVGASRNVRLVWQTPISAEFLAILKLLFLGGIRPVQGDRLESPFLSWQDQTASIEKAEFICFEIIVIDISTSMKAPRDECTCNENSKTTYCNLLVGKEITLCFVKVHNVNSYCEIKLGRIFSVLRLFGIECELLTLKIDKNTVWESSSSNAQCWFLLCLISHFTIEWHSYTPRLILQKKLRTI